jgi:hypothetical protein
MAASLGVSELESAVGYSPGGSDMSRRGKDSPSVKCVTRKTNIGEFNTLRTLECVNSKL